MTNKQIVKYVDSMSLPTRKALDKEVRNRFIVAYIIETRMTVREVGEVFGLSKSAIWHICQNSIPVINKHDREKLQAVFEEHSATRHLRGGEATKKHWAAICANA